MYVRALINTMVEFALSMWANFISFLSFNSETENLVEALNHKLDEPPAKLAIRQFSHPGGFVRELSKRRMSIAGAIIKISHDNSIDDVDERLASLKLLADQSLHAKTINMPLNTARIQIHLMKEAVKSRHHRRRQLEAMADFGLASFGQEAVIRGFLNKYNLVEVPEEDLPLRKLDMGWDDHVHDTLTEGRKTATQVMLDAFIKGISRLTMVYSHIEHRNMIRESITAGQILGIEVKIGIEFSIGRMGFRRHYMYIPPATQDAASFFAFFDKRHQVFAPFIEGLKTNAENRRKTISTALERFNSVQRSKINAGYSPDHPCWFPALTLEELDRIVACGQISRTHVAELLFNKFRDITHRRVLFHKAQVLAARERFKRGIYSEWELRNITSQYDHVREQFESMTPDTLLGQYLESRDVVDYDSVFPEEEDTLALLSKQGGSIAMIHPLELGLKESMLHILRFGRWITHVETMNLRDSVGRNQDSLIIFNKFIYILNNKPTEDLIHFLDQYGISELDEASIREAHQQVQRHPITPICGSDSTGRDPTIPGMGFIRITSIPPKVLGNFREHHFKMPRPIADLIINNGKKDPDARSSNDSSDIICMGKIGKPFRNLVGDEKQVELVDPLTFWNYLNPSIKNLLRIAIGFTSAYLTIGIEFALVWFGITSIRNILVDLIAASGLQLKNWSFRNVNHDNISQSLFWTGFSVPILNTVKKKFDYYWELFVAPAGGIAFESIKFFFICLANGLYISTHNKLRNFDPKVIRVNFFRSVLAWPFATVFSPLGNMLGIPSIVQAKLWSDIIGGIIEGTGKYSQRFKLRQRDLMETLPRLDSHDREARLIAMIDILYIWAVQPRGKTCLEQLLFPQLLVRRWWEFWKRSDTAQGPTPEVQIIRQRFSQLLELFSDPGCLSLLSEFVLRNFSDREAVILSELIGTHTEDFVGWLRSIRRRFNPPL